MNNNNILGTYLDSKETLYTEYKEFCFKLNIYDYFSKSQVGKIIYLGNLPKKFDNIVFHNIKKYIDIYVAKYASSFHNTKNNILKNNMEFIIGVNDDAEITGVPYSGCTTELKTYLESYIQNHLFENLNKKCCLDVTLHIHECSIQMDFLDDSYMCQEIKKQETIQNHYKIVNRKYKKKRKQWIKDIMKYKGKLQTALNDQSFLNELRLYLYSIDKLEEFKDDIRSDFVFDIDQIKDYKVNKKHFMYWLIVFKDMKANTLMGVKPKPPSIQKLPNLEFCACTQLSMLRHRLLSNNQKLKYYTILINIKKKNYNCRNEINFKDPRHSNWRTVHRCLDNNQPYCSDI